MVLENKQELLARSFEIAAAIAYFEDAIQESDETISECSPNLQAEMEEQKRHFAVALEAMERLARVEAERDAAKRCIYDIETYLTLGSAQYIGRTIQA